MAVISRQHFSKSDSAFQTRQAAFGDKGAQLKTSVQERQKSPIYSRYHIDFMTSSDLLH